MMTQTQVDNDLETSLPPKHLREGIFRHYAPPPEEVDLGGEEGVWHTIISCFSGDVVGQVIRWVWNDGEVGFECRIDGLEETAGTCDLFATTIDSLADVAYVANSLRYEWEILTGVYPDREWTYWFTPRCRNVVYPNV